MVILTEDNFFFKNGFKSGRVERLPCRGGQVFSVVTNIQEQHLVLDGYWQYAVWFSQFRRAF